MKDPAFLFYYQDFIVGTTFMTLEEKGAYITLLCFLADKEGIIEENILKIIPLAIWEAICCKFQKKDGLFFNKRLSDEIEKRRLYTASRRKNLHMDNHMGNHMKKHKKKPYVAHMENENENININKDIDINSIWYKELKTDFPNIDLDSELKKMYLWLKDNPRKNLKKTFRNWLLNCKPKGNYGTAKNNSGKGSE